MGLFFSIAFGIGFGLFVGIVEVSVGLTPLCLFNMLWLLLIYNLYTAAFSILNGLLHDYINCVVFGILTIVGVASHVKTKAVRRLLVVCYFASIFASISFTVYRIINIDNTIHDIFKRAIETNVVGYEATFVKDYLWFGIFISSICMIGFNALIALAMNFYLVRVVRGKYQ